MWELAFTQQGLRPNSAPCRNAVNWLSTRIAKTRQLRIAIGGVSCLQNPHVIRIDLPKQTGNADRLARDLSQFLWEITSVWQVDLVLEAHKNAVDMVLSAVPHIPPHGVSEIHLFCAQTGSVDTFLKLDGLGQHTPKIINHVEPHSWARMVHRYKTPTHGPSDQPICMGYLFKHSFWSDQPS